MARVMKTDGCMFIITHAGIKNRKRVFGRGLGFENFDYSFSK
jgi:hypothetical protein